MVRVEVRFYRRRLRHPLQTAHGSWQWRTGLVLRLLADDGRVAWGEIAPLPWFGSETLEQSLQFLRQVPQFVAAADTLAIPNSLPATQFGWESAWEMLLHPVVPERSPLPQCVLLPTGDQALTVWPSLCRSLGQTGGGTLKWKIGVAPMPEELTWFQRLMADLPPEMTLRLDANGHLSLAQARCWLEVCDRFPNVEFLEQPLPPAQLDRMLALQHDYATPLALDESVATVDQLEAVHEQGWRGFVVLKAAIAGSPNRLRQVCQRSPLRGVWSSVLETTIARTYITTRLIPSIALQPRAIGFGVDHWFTDHWHTLTGDRLWHVLGEHCHDSIPS